MLRHPYAITHLETEPTPQKEGAGRKIHYNAGQRWRTLVVVMTGTMPAVVALLVAAFWAVVVVAVPTAAALVVEVTRVPGVTAGGLKTLANIALARDGSSAREASSPVPRALALLPNPLPRPNGGNALPVHVRGRREAINTMHMHARFARVNRAARAMADAVLGRSVRCS